MRRLVLLASAWAVLPVFAQTAPSASHPVTKLPTPTAEPENAQGYAPPAPREKEAPSTADIGPAQKRFAMMTITDDLVSQDDAPTGNTVPGEKIALDKRIKIPLVHDVLNDSGYKGGDNQALLFEVKYLNWGAVTAAQLRARQGHYFTVTWDNGGPRGDFTTRLEYRQVKSKAVVRVLEQKHVNVSGATRSYFAVVNDAYLAYGPVSSWRFTVLRGDAVVAEAKSFIW